VPLWWCYAVKTAKLLVNVLMRETLSATDKERMMWMGNILLLSSSLQVGAAGNMLLTVCYLTWEIINIGAQR
jgi:hypothetical protein